MKDALMAAIMKAVADEQQERQDHERMFRMTLDDYGLSASLNLWRSLEFCTNNRGQKLHLRSYASKGPHKGIVVQIHGYGAHCSRINTALLAQHFTARQYHYVAFDLHGHGYSQGDRHMILDHQHLLDDVSAVLHAIYRPDDAEDSADMTDDAPDSFDTPTVPAEPSSNDPAQPTKSPAHHIILPPQLLFTPFYLMGSSLGGALSMLFSQHLQNPPTPTSIFCAPVAHAPEPAWRGAFRGCILCAPSLAVKKPNVAVLAALEYLVVPVVPSMPIPSAFWQGLPDDAIWESPEYIRYVHSDAKAGLSSCGSMAFRTAQSVLKLGDVVQQGLPDSDFPILILHDKEDRICMYEGSERVRSCVRDPTKVEIVDIPGGLHDVITNQMDSVLGHIDAWLEKL